MIRKVTETNYDLILRDGEPTVIITRKKRNANFGSTATGTTNLILDAVNQTMNATDHLSESAWSTDSKESNNDSKESTGE
jgi:hypothetical protein